MLGKNAGSLLCDRLVVDGRRDTSVGRVLAADYNNCMENTANPQQTAAEFMDQVPERCRDCPRVELDRFTIGRRVELNQLDTTEAQVMVDETITDIKRKCRLGATAVSGCFGPPQCNYGIIKN